MLETRLSKINYIGQDGFHWFVGQVTPDPAWRDSSNTNGYRAKVRILGKHPATAEVPDSELPWAHFATSPTLGTGKGFSGHSFFMQGGETVVGFFLDGDDAQQPIVIAALSSGQNEQNLMAFDDAVQAGTTGFLPLSANYSLDFSRAVRRADGERTEDNGLPDNNGLTPDGQLSQQQEIDEKEIVVAKAKPCKGGKGFMSDVSRTLASFVAIGNGLQEYKEGFIDPVLGEIYNIQALISSSATIIAGGFAQLIRLSRKFLFQEIKKISENIVTFLLPDSLLKDIAISKAMDTIFCVIENIVKGLKGLIEDFLNQLLGKVVNMPLCAAEAAIAGLVANINDKIQGVIGPAMEAIQGILGPIGSFMGFINKAMGYVQMGLKFLSCEGDICPPEPYDWAANFGPSKKSVADFKRSINITNGLSAAGIGASVTSMINGLFDIDESKSGPVAALVGGCPTDVLKCGAPSIEIFGGGGIGAAARAVVNEVGQVVGVNMTDFGSGYAKKPFVTISDSCDNGRGATGTAVVEDGKVTNIIITNTGGGYLGPETATSDNEGEEVVGEIVGIDVINTGKGYDEDSLIVSGCGTLKPQLDQEGRIVGADIVQSDIGCKVLPKLQINSATGFGAVIRPVMKFRKREEYSKTVNIPQSAVLKVVDCVSSY